MMGMEKMISSMLGITPEAMGEMVTGFQGLLTGLSAQLIRIEENQALILTLISEKFDGNGSDDSGSPALGSDCGTADS